jgi:two-component system CheB/CheR fusion protein
MKSAPTEIADDLDREQLLAQIASLQEAQDRFLAILSHELRTPLTPIVLTAQMLKRRPDLPEPVREAIEMIHRNVNLEARLVNDLLDLARISRGQMEVVRAPMDVHDAITQAVEIARPDFVAKWQKLDLKLDAYRDHIEGDAARIQQVVWNLLKNASKFSPEGGEIRLATCNLKGILVIEVSDSGIGIEPDAIERIFDPFEQANAGISRKFGGLGFGLAISKAVIEAHRGTLRVQSAGLGKGATFTARLPLADPA